jgi:hypothetical protein
MNQTFFSKNKNMSRIYRRNLNRLTDGIKNNYIQIVFFIIISLSLSSCVEYVEEISWDIKNHPPMLVVDGVVTNQLKNQCIRLTLSNTYFSTADPAPVHDASVHISEGDKSYELIESSDNKGWYFSNEPFAGVSGKTYDLYISLKEDLNGQIEYTSSSTMTEGLDIDSIRCEIYPMPKEFVEGSDNKIIDTTILVIYYYGNEPKSPGNYYSAKIYRNNMPLMSSVKSYPFANDQERNGAYINFMAVIRNVAAHDTITFDLFSINKAYYKYIDAISKIDQTGDISSPQGPPANAVGNVDGALGFFIATYISTGKSLAIDMR